VLASGIEPGELVILSPLERSQISLKFKVLDVNDPSKVLVEPVIEKDEEDDEDETKDGDETEEAAEFAKKERRKKDRKKKTEGGN